MSKEIYGNAEHSASEIGECVGSVTQRQLEQAMKEITDTDRPHKKETSGLEER